MKPLDALAVPGAAQVWAALPQARIVGGAVRDLLAGLPVGDVDFAVPQDLVRLGMPSPLRCPISGKG